MNDKQPLNLFFPEANIASDFYINGFSLDSRGINKGEAFIALEGRKYNGTQFINEAIAKGANCVLVDKEIKEIFSVSIIKIDDLRNKLPQIIAEFYHHPSKKMNLIGVTGTNGKSSIVYMLSYILSELGEKTAQIGTLGCGSWKDLAECYLTTPDIVQLQKSLSNLLKDSYKTVALEVSSIGIEERRIGMIDFNVGIFTNLTTEHLDYHGNMNAYKQAKQKLFTDYELDTIIVNTDDSFGKELSKLRLKDTKIITYGLKDADFCINKFNNSLEGMRLEVKTPKYNYNVTTNLIGNFNIYNLLAILAYLEYKGFDSRYFLRLFSKLPIIPGRMQLISPQEGVRVFVDFAHTPDAIANSLITLKKLTTGKLVCVFGCGGNRDRVKRSLMGEVVDKLADVIYITDDNPRDEDPKIIVNDILSGMINKGKVRVVHDRAEAIFQAISSASSDDIVLVAGKGHENYQIYGNTRKNFNDASEVRKVLHKL
ncbi:MAG: UDP-N-acetylmuramoyl-L-alanyl-D-glutamate--2,6-diaminopimelate ligase [Legionellales bacterium]|nr:UDP-N-acetylmuramoyl-L-alanyl-D-glutamate--2,6-diaminopimelate ligase [Legionellales bacterium]